MGFERENWDARFREGEYLQDPEPPKAFRQYIDIFPDGKALDIATGSGRLSVFLARKGYEVDAIDQSKEGLKIARQRAKEHSVKVNWIQANAIEFEYPKHEYELITIRSFRVLDRLTDIKNGLKPDGILFYQDHIRTSKPLQSGPSDDRLRLGANELLRACLDLTVLHYKEFTIEKDDDRLDAYAQLIARKSTESAQSLPRQRVYQE